MYSRTIMAILCLSTLLHGCTSSAPQEPKLSNTDIILGNLHRVKNAQVGVAYLDPEADFGRYTSVMLDPLDMSRTEIIQPNRSMSAVARRPTELTDRNIETIQKAFAEVFTRELQETGDYTIVTEPGPDVLRVTAAVTQIAPTAPGDDPRSRAMGRVRVYTEGAGSMAITFGFIDSQSNQVLAVVKDARNGMFGRWARMLRARLDIAHGY